MTPRRLDLALQGGGSHGAFTWGVLDRLLDDERIRIGAISGTSAEAMNAVALAAGWVADGRRGARDEAEPAQPTPKSSASTSASSTGNSSSITLHAMRWSTRS
jgi:predicted acylesterase/phospholipase RssA